MQMETHTVSRCVGTNHCVLRKIFLQKIVTVYNCISHFQKYTHDHVYIGMYMNKHTMPTSCTPGIGLKEQEAKGSKNMTGVFGGGKHCVGST